MPIQFENKKMFFGQVGGQPKKSPLSDFESSKEPTSGYYTTAPASLPGGPPPCDHVVQKTAIDPGSYVEHFACINCGKKWTLSYLDAQYARQRPHNFFI